MQMGFELNLQQTQKLIMTPELRQAIAILQLSSLELVDFIQKQVQENPALEIAEDENIEETQAATKEETEKFDVDWQEYFQDGSDLGYTRIPREKYREINYDNFLSKPPTLEEHLLAQLDLFRCTAFERRIAEFLIGNLDKNGYLCVSLEEVVKMCKCEPQKAEAALALVQSFDPSGIGARSLSECLLLQLEHKGLQEDELLKHFIADYLEDLAKGGLQKVAQELKVDIGKVQEMVDIIQTLDPKPGRWFADSEQVTYIVPDIVVEKVEGEFIVLVNDVAAPRLGINQVYRKILAGNSVDTHAKKFIEGKLDAALWVIKSIEQRRMTLYRVATSLVEYQREFLEKGVNYLRPLNLKQIAEKLGVHESTVSRATNNKYIQTPVGVFSLKFFFASGVSGRDDSITSVSVKNIIKKQIDSEDPYKPYTDQEVTDMLAKKGIEVSRRTVAKYRDELGIASSNRRKRY